MAAVPAWWPARHQLDQVVKKSRVPVKLSLYHTGYRTRNLQIHDRRNGNRINLQAGTLFLPAEHPQKTLQQSFFGAG
jgi:hypothetical protein